MKTAVERLAREPEDAELFADLDRFVETHGIRLDMQALLEDIDQGRR